MYAAFCRVWRLAVPLMINNIAGYALSIVGAIYIGRLGALPLSASVLANSVYNCTGLSLALGLSAGMETLCGQVRHDQQGVALHGPRTDMSLEGREGGGPARSACVDHSSRSSRCPRRVRRVLAGGAPASLVEPPSAFFLCSGLACNCDCHQPVITKHPALRVGRHML